VSVDLSDRQRAEDWLDVVVDVVHVAGGDAVSISLVRSHSSTVYPMVTDDVGER
jgi:hypothetical protein